MKDSVTYQAIVEEGEIRGSQEMIIYQGRKKFGVPSPQTEMTLRAITDVDRLKLLTERLLDASG